MRRSDIVRFLSPKKQRPLAFKNEIFTFIIVNKSDINELSILSSNEHF